MILSKLR